MARVADAGIIQVAQKASLAHGAGAVEGGHAVMASGTMETHSRGTVVDILTTAFTSPAVDAYTAVAAQRVEAGAPVVAGIGLQLTLVHILRAELACPLRGTLAVVGVDTVHTGSPIETPVSWTVVHIHFAVLTLKARQAGTVIGEITTLSTGAPVAARRGSTGHCGVLTQGPRVPPRALAAEGARRVEAGAAMAAGPSHPALIHITSAAAALIARRAGADKAAIRTHGAAGTVSTGAAEAGVRQGAVWTSKAPGAPAGETGSACNH